MSYPGPPGVSSNSPHPSLPPRPPAPARQSAGFKPALPPSSTSYSPNPAPGYSTPTSYTTGRGYNAGPPRQYGAQPAAAPYPSYSQAPTVGATATAYSQTSSYNYPQRNYPQPNYPQQQTYYGASNASYSTPPQIRNPFPAPDMAAAGGDNEVEMAAQIAHWQSAYMPREAADPTSTKNPSSSSGTTTPAVPPTTDATQVIGPADPTAPGDKKQTVYREGGGKKWTDDSLLEWDPSHLRLFVGNLAGEVTDESLLKAFSRWGSVQKAKVVRDKRTNKSKGYGFVSFSDPDDFFQAAKEMNGKYIQSHPVVVHKAKTEIKPQVMKDDRYGKNNKKGRGNGNKARGGGGGGGGGGGSGRGYGGSDTSTYEPHLGPAAGGGVTKPGQKTRGGLKLLG